MQVYRSMAFLSPTPIERLAPELLGMIFGFVHADEISGHTTSTLNARLSLPGWIDSPPEERTRWRGDTEDWSSMEWEHIQLLALVRSGAYFPFSVSRVCKRWDAVSSMYSAFWTRVVLFVDEGYPPPPFTLDYFARSRNRELDVIITLQRPASYRNPSPLDEGLVIDMYLKALAPHLSRCRSLHIDALLGSSLPTLGLDFKGAARRLNFFSLSSLEDDNHPKSLDRVNLWEAISEHGGQHAPLHFDVAPKAMILDSTNLKAILRSRELQRWFCGHDRQLQFLTIQNVVSEPTITWVPTPDSSRLSLSRMLYLLECYSWLASLTLSRLVFDLVDGTHLDNTFELAGIEELHFIDISPGDVIQFFSRADVPELRILDLRRCKDIPKDIFTLFNNLGVVEKLIITDTTPTLDASLEDFLSWWQGMRLQIEAGSSATVNSLLDDLSRPYHEEGPPPFVYFSCHNIWDLCLSVPPDFDSQALRRFVEQRARHFNSGLALKNLHITYGSCEDRELVSPLSEEDLAWLQKHVGKLSIF